MRTLLAGDIHGNPNHLVYLYQQGLEFDVDCIFALGDFGYWEHQRGGPEFLEVCSDLAVGNDMPLYWLDGNHENHVRLQQYATELVDDGMWEIRKNLFYSPRGNRFTWDGVRFMTFGGAYSVDRWARRAGTSFWFEEEITQQQVDAVSNEPIDILLSHDLPDGVHIREHMERQHRPYYKDIPEADSGRGMLRQVVQKVRPTHVYHGHYHLRYSEIVNFGYGSVRVEGLSQDDSGQDSWTIIDTKDFR